MVAFLAAACGDNGETGELRQRIADLEATLSAPTATPTREPDRVVGINERCTLMLRSGGGGRLELQGTEAAGTCPTEHDAASGILRLDWRKELVVRTASGTTYQTTVSGDTSVTIGDPWPPTR
jgi:hypothetical protein